MRNWTHRAGRMEVGRGRVVPGSLSGRRGRDTGRDTLFHRESSTNLALTPTLSHPKRAGEGERQGRDREVETERDWPLPRDLELTAGRDTLFHRENAGEFDLSADRRESRGTRTRNGTRLNCTGRAGIGTWNGRTPSPPTPLPQGARGESLWDWDGIRDSMGRWTGLESAGTAAPTSPSDRF
jgi:hypothetical protein